MKKRNTLSKKHKSKVAMRINGPAFFRLFMVALILAANPLSLQTSTAAPQKASISMGLMKDSCFYSPDAKPAISIAFNNGTRKSIGDVSIQMKFQNPCSSREALESAMETGTRRTYRFSRTLLEGHTIKPGHSGIKIEFPLNGKFSVGVHPFVLEAVQSGAVIASVPSILVVCSPEYMKQFKRLKLSMVFDVSEPPHKQPDGYFHDTELAEECSAGEKTQGWLYTLTDELAKRENLRAALSVSPLLLDEISDISNGFEYKKDGKDIKVSQESTYSRNAASVLDMLRLLTQQERLQFLPTPYSSPDLETLTSLGWYDDAKAQAEEGKKKLERILDSVFGKEFYYPPGLLLNTKAMSSLEKIMGKFLILSPQLLDRNYAGRKLLSGLTLSAPVRIKTEKDECIAIFSDSRLESLVRKVRDSNDAHSIAQWIIGELMTLFEERPSVLRSCAFIWPGWWRPDESVLREVLSAIEGAPFLETVTLGECLMSVPPVNRELLKIPEAQTKALDKGDLELLKIARERSNEYLKCVSGKIPQASLVKQNLYIAESHLWREWGKEKYARKYSTEVVRTVADEFAKLEMPSPGTVNLTSEKAKIPLSIVNGTGYPVKANIELSSNGLSFPQGRRKKVRLEPKENLLEIPVEVKAKGSVRFHARLYSGHTTIAEVYTRVRTSRLNTFAILIVGVLLGLIGLIWIFRLYRRYQAGKHRKRKRKNHKEKGEEGP
ncbi:MAG: DUF6049 family protein [Actinomycetota bacterium]|nr:DUF6049 family protein [Actinomycetota bacterium]